MKKRNNRTPNAEITLQGVSGVQGFAIGAASMYERSSLSVTVDKVDDEQLDEELARFKDAYAQTEQELKQMMGRQKDKKAEAVVGTQIAILRDPELNKSIEQNILKKNEPADLAVQSAFDAFLSVMSEGGLSEGEGTVDITDVRDRLIQFLHGFNDDGMDEGTILIAHELSPREVITCSENNIKGIVMDRGGVNGHAAIIARSIGLPMILGAPKATAEISEGDEVVIDGETGQVLVNPDGPCRDQYGELIDQQEERFRKFKEICKQPNETRDGFEFNLQANVEFEGELQTIQQYGIEGIGLLRTESVYLQRDFDDVEQQQLFYDRVLKSTAPHAVTIRLFDAGGDKIMGFENDEANPYLGTRGVRLLLKENKLLERQLRAICRTAANYPGRVRILVPMVTTVEQFKQVRKKLDQVQNELKDEGLQVDQKLLLGMMIEVPSVALQADLFAAEADFFSIGSNDLTQYLLAVDRGNEQLAHLYNQRHPAVWKLIKNAGDAVQKSSKPLYVCGELASDPVAACALIGMGINELSMNPAALPPVKKMLRSRSRSEMQQLADDIGQCQTVSEVNNLFDDWENE